MRKRDWIGIAAAAWIIGVSALLCEHFAASQAVVIAMRSLFGIAASGAIGLVLVTEARVLTGASEPELYRMTRLISRWVYILMYTLALLRVGLYLDEADQLRPVRSMDDFQFFIGCCVIPLWAVRAVVLALPLRRRDREALTEANGDDWSHRPRPRPRTAAPTSA